MSLPRRIQLVKLLRAHGLRDVERMRTDELKEALSRLRLAIPDPLHDEPLSSASSTFIARVAEPPPVLVDDSDDPYAVARFREPKLSLPYHQRTFLRAIAVKPRLLFCTWDVREDQRTTEGPLQLQLFWREFLGEAPELHEILQQEPAARIDVELSSPGSYVNVPGERLALAAALVVTTSGRRIAESNLCLTPPARPAPPGPLWLATMPPTQRRQRFAVDKVFAVAEANVRRVGETDARFVGATAATGATDASSDAGDTSDASGHALPSSSQWARAQRAALPWPGCTETNEDGGGDT